MQTTATVEERKQSLCQQQDDERKKINSGVREKRFFINFLNKRNRNIKAEKCYEKDEGGEERERNKHHNYSASATRGAKKFFNFPFVFLELFFFREFFFAFYFLGCLIFNQIEKLSSRRRRV